MNEIAEITIQGNLVSPSSTQQLGAQEYSSSSDFSSLTMPRDLSVSANLDRPDSISNVARSASQYSEIVDCTEEVLFKSTVKSLISEAYPELGEVCPAEIYILNHLERDRFAAQAWIQTIFLEAFRIKDQRLAVAILILIARLSEGLMAPANRAIALNALVHINDVIKEYGIRAFEKWASRDSIEFLENVHCASKRIDKYRQKVIRDLKEVSWRS